MHRKFSPHVGLAAVTVVALASGTMSCGARAALSFASGDAAIDPDATEGPRCRVHEQDLSRFPAELLVVLDRSGSMGRRSIGGAGSLWQEVTASLDGAVQRTEGLVRWSLKLFPSVSGCDVDDGIEVPSEAGAEAVRAVLQTSGPATIGMGTPTEAAIRKATEYLAKRKSEKLQYLVLATDGQPSCGGGRGDVDGTVQAMRDANKKGLHTFVVGIAIEGSRENDALNEMAIAGGEPRAGALRYYSALNRREFDAALGPIISFVSCALPLQRAATPDEPVNVVIDGQTVPQSADEGWTLNENRRSVSLNGTFCERIREHKVLRLVVSVGCDANTSP